MERRCRQKNDDEESRVCNIAESTRTSVKQVSVEIPARNQKWCRNDTIPLASLGEDPERRMGTKSQERNGWICELENTPTRRKLVGRSSLSRMRFFLGSFRAHNFGL